MQMRECVICTEQTRTHALVPCGHMCVCAGCSKVLLESKEAKDDKTLLCPICRAEVSTIIRVYA